MTRKLVMHIPKEIATALSRRHNGREDITREEILDAVAKMNILFSMWQKVDARLTWIYDVFWEKERIEAHYGTPKFYGAHRRLKNAQKKRKDLHQQMFALMVYTDGNYEPFSSDAMDARSIVEDFNSKYLKRLKKMSK